MKAQCGVKCRNCGSTKSIEYHHIIPLVFGGKDVLSNIVPICSDCHALIHFGKTGQISHSEATKRGMMKAKQRGKQLGRKCGTTVETTKAVRAKGLILALSSDFRGHYTDKEVINTIGNISRNTYYKYKKELKDEVKNMKETYGSAVTQ